MTIWQFLYPFVGDVHVPVTLTYLGICFLISVCVLHDRFVFALAYVTVLALIMEVAPGMTMAANTALIVFVLRYYRAVQLDLGGIWEPMETGTQPEPVIEYDVDGLPFAYKGLTEIDGEYYSPIVGTHWKNNALTADARPHRWNTNGIYVYWNKDDLWMYGDVGAKVKLYGKATVYTRGARAYHAEIVEVERK